MKKTIALAIALIMALTLAACGGSNDRPSGGNTTPPTNTPAPTPGSQPSETPSGTEGTPDPTPTPVDPNERGNTTGNIRNGGRAAEKDGWFYIHDYANRSLIKMRADGSERAVLAEGNCEGGINVAGGWVYYLYSRGIHRIREDGSEGSEVVRSGWSRPPDSLTVIGEWCYYHGITYGGSEEDGIYKIRTDGTDVTRLFEGGVSNVNVVGDWIYFVSTPTISTGGTSNDGAYKMRTDGTEKTEITVEEPVGVHSWGGTPAYIRNIRGILIDGDHIYLNDNTSWWRLDMDLTNGVFFEHLSFSTAADGWMYYWASKDNRKSALYKTDIDGEVTIEIGEFDIRYPNIVGDWIYGLGDDPSYRTVTVRVRTDGTGFEIL